MRNERPTLSNHQAPSSRGSTVLLAAASLAEVAGSERKAPHAPRSVRAWGARAALALGVLTAASTSRGQEAPAPAAAAGATVTPAAALTTPSGAKVPTYVDDVERGARLRFELGGRYVTAGLPAPPIRLEVDDKVNETDDLDVMGSVLFAWDRPGDLPFKADLFADGLFDIGGDSPVSPFLDSQSAFPRARLYSAFIGLSPGPADGFLRNFRINLGRQTELVDSPVTYDGGSIAAHFNFQDGSFGARVWGGLDAPQWLVDDPITRTDRKSYVEAYVDELGTGGVEAERTFNVDGVPLLTAVGGARVEATWHGFGAALTHTSMPSLFTFDRLPAAQLSKLALSYSLDIEWVRLRLVADLKASDFIPRSTNWRADALTGDGTTRIGAFFSVQFLQDEVAYDGTFRAFNFNANFDPARNALIEAFRQQDQIRHLNFGPPEPHILMSLDAERELPADFAVQARARLRQHFDRNLVDAFHTNLYDGAVGATWSPGMALDVGTEFRGGFVDSGDEIGAGLPNANGVVVNANGIKNNAEDFDLIFEGVATYIEGRLFARTRLLNGRLSTQAEVFVRRQDLVGRANNANGQFSTAFSTQARYRIFDAWDVSARFDADALSPYDSLNASGYLGALVATSVRF